MLDSKLEGRGGIRVRERANLDEEALCEVVAHNENHGDGGGGVVRRGECGRRPGVLELPSARWRFAGFTR